MRATDGPRRALTIGAVHGGQHNRPAVETALRRAARAVAAVSPEVGGCRSSGYRERDFPSVGAHLPGPEACSVCGIRALLELVAGWKLTVAPGLVLDHMASL